MISGTMVTFANIGLRLVMYPIYLHFLGYERYGVWLILTTVLSFLQIGGNLGIEPAVTKLVAEEYGRKDTHGIQSYVTIAIVLLTTSSSLGLVIVLFLKTQIISAFKLSGNNAVVASKLLPYIGFLHTYIFITRTLSATLAGLGRMDLMHYIPFGSRVVSLAVTTALLCNGHGIESLLIGSVVSFSLIHIFSLIFIRRIVHVRFLRLSNWDGRRFRNLLRFGSGVFSGSILGMLVSPFNKLMLSRYAGIDTIPVYDLTYEGAVMFRGIFSSATNAIMPEISRLYGEGTDYGKERIKAVNIQCMKVIGYLALPCYGLLMLIAEPLLRLWLRTKYVDTMPTAFRLMLIVTFISLSAVPSHFTIMGFGKVRYFLMAGIIGAGGNFVLVTAYYVLTGHISVYSLGLCLIAVFTASTTYLVYKAHHLLTWRTGQLANIHV